MARPLIAGITVLILAFLAYDRWPQVRAKVWHWRHGSMITVGDYEVPVPEQWLVVEYENADIVTLVDTRSADTRDPLADVNAISVFATKYAYQDLDRLATLERQRLQREGLTQIEEKTIRAGDERMVCLGGTEFRDIMHVPDTVALSLWCYSTGRLSLLFNGNRAGLQQFYAIVSGVRKRK